LNNEFLKYYFDCQPFQETLNLWAGSGSTRSYLGITGQLNLQIKIPEINTQKKIAAVLSALDAKIELNNRINAELESLAKTIYDYWFVQFDFPNADGKPYKSSGGEMVYNKELKRAIPASWEIGTLADLANITTGKLDSNTEVLGGEYPFFTCAKNPTRIDNYAFDDNVILIAGNNANGNFHVNRYNGKFNAYQRTYIITSKSNIDLEYLYQVLKEATKSFKSQGKGSQTKFLTIGMLTGVKVFIKNDSLTGKFYDLVNPMYNKINLIEQENQQLTQLRDWLLPMLMNGQVSIK
jgi:type I restriction enzyme S subunit